MDLHQYGWNNEWQNKFSIITQPGWIPGRILSQSVDLYQIITEFGEMNGKISGRWRYESLSSTDYPVTGDWVALQPSSGSNAVIHSLCQRANSLMRKQNTKQEAQLLGANIDFAFIVTSLDHDFNPRRLERYLVIAWENNIQPVILLNKADLCGEAEDRLREAEAVAIGAPIHMISAKQLTGLESVRSYCQTGNTIILIGSSGVGKSTLTNALLGKSIQPTQSIREDDSHGRHTTTRKSLFLLPEGGLLLDTPGLREIQLWGDTAGLSSTFADIESLSQDCRFQNCQHESEPGCAVKDAIEKGKLPQERLDSYHKLQKELQYQSSRENYWELEARRKKWKMISKMVKKLH
ncbi:ribosome small subunit-dependent GTPase A [bacterium]|nr:ribosome small subunit-dependent GTPase A [bacterium]